MNPVPFIFRSFLVPFEKEWDPPSVRLRTWLYTKGELMYTGLGLLGLHPHQPEKKSSKGYKANLAQPYLKRPLVPHSSTSKGLYPDLSRSLSLSQFSTQTIPKLAEILKWVSSLQHRHRHIAVPLFNMYSSEALPVSRSPLSPSTLLSLGLSPSIFVHCGSSLIRDWSMHFFVLLCIFFCQWTVRFVLSRIFICLSNQ